MNIPWIYNFFYENLIYPCYTRYSINYSWIILKKHRHLQIFLIWKVFTNCLFHWCMVFDYYAIINCFSTSKEQYAGNFWRLGVWIKLWQNGGVVWENDGAFWYTLISAKKEGKEATKAERYEVSYDMCNQKNGFRIMA